MKKIAAIFLLSALPSLALGAEYGEAQDLIGIYGQVVSTPSSGGNTAGGIGIFASAVNRQLWFAHMGFNYSDGAAISGGTITGTSPSGSTSVTGASSGNGYGMQFNLRLGKLFEVAPQVAIGPYLAYQYAKFDAGLNGEGSARYENNAAGGGVEVTTDLGGPFDFTGHLGYLAGISASSSANGYGAANPPSSGVLQLGVRGVYAFSSHFSAFAGIVYDRYHASYSYVPASLSVSATVNEIRGLAGLAYHF